MKNAIPSQSDANLPQAVDNPWFVVSVFIAFGCINILLYYNMPIIRNAMIYAHVTYSLLELGNDFSIVDHAFNKAIGFPFLSIPFVKLFNANIGLKVSSFVWTTLWAISMVFFFKRIRKVFCWNTESNPSMRLLLTVLFLNPLICYQFISAYPDSLNALTFLWALYFLDRMISTEARWFDSVLFTLVTLLAIWVKHHGFVILAVLLIFALCRLNVIKTQWTNARKELFVALASLVGLLIVISLAQTGYITLFNLSHNKANYSKGFSDLPRIVFVVIRNLDNFKNYLLLSFSIFIPLLFRWKAFAGYKEWYLTVLLFIGSLLVYHGAGHNIRYFLPIAPLLVWIACNNLNRIRSKVRYPLIVLFCVINCFLILYYNNIEFHKTINKVYQFSNHDNLRLVDEQNDVSKYIQTINNGVNDHRNTLFFVNPYYYGNAMWHIWEKDGLFDKRLNIVYMRQPNWDKIGMHDARQYQISQAFFYMYIPIYLKIKNKPSDIRTKIKNKMYRYLTGDTKQNERKHAFLYRTINLKKIEKIYNVQLKKIDEELFRSPLNDQE